jgi:hypothetical protein
MAFFIGQISMFSDGSPEKNINTYMASVGDNMF